MEEVGIQINGCQRAQSGLPERARFEPASIDALTCPLLKYICIPTDTSVLHTEESVGIHDVPVYGIRKKIDSIMQLPGA